MLDNLLSYIAPHYCCGCGKIGSLICANCKYNITYEPNVICVACKKPTVGYWLCNTCKMPYERIWVVGERTGILQRLIGLYKFERTRSAFRVLGDLILDTIPELPINTVIVPIPTIPTHIRQRGYDHMLLIAKYLALRRKLEYSNIIQRKTNSVQRGANAKKRKIQAMNAFIINEKIDTNKTYLLIDDVFTTGATIKYASLALRNAGAKHIWVAIIARQTLD